MSPTPLWLLLSEEEKWTFAFSHANHLICEGINLQRGIVLGSISALKLWHVLLVFVVRSVFAGCSCKIHF